jgi:hypothetical protein
MKWSTWLAALAEKVTPHNDDVLILLDSEASYAPKKVKKSNVAGSSSTGGGSLIRDELYDSGYIAEAAASFDVSSISQDYDHLEVWIHVRTARSNADDTLLFNINNDTTNGNYLRAQHYFGTGHGSDNTADRYIGSIPGASATANHFSDIRIILPFYTSAHIKRQFILGDNFGSTYYGREMIRYWASTSAINRLTFISGNSVNLAIGSRLQIIGVKGT